ncbi:Lrp/AsnC ligand binding domain-containing protein [Candidatus Calescamantes bacterium]|nr:Lrp/AsnC ligand binding domain-containing protein [bacterium]MCK5223934.1 Lrp/AsnC ligand binding domain-containing protein [Candidatus Calescamantes bacterium]
MIGAYLLINTDGKEDERVLEELNRFPEVSNAHIVTGLHDIIVFVQEENIEKLTSFMIGRIRKIQGITRTVTCIAVK